MTKKVACVACGRVVAASKDGRPRPHKATSNLTAVAGLSASSRRAFASANAPWCDGSNHEGDVP